MALHQQGLQVIRPPSLVRKYDAFYSGDPAFKQLDADASDEARKAHEHAWKVARETGDHSPLLSGDGQPTKFVMQPIGSESFAMLIDMIRSRSIGQNEMASLAFRLALIDVVNFGDVKIERSTHKIGSLASLAWLDASGLPASESLKIIDELGDVAIRKAQGLSPS